MRQWSGGTISPAESFEMSFIRHGDELSYIQWLNALLWRYRETTIEEKGRDWLPLCCPQFPYDTSYLVRDALE